MELRFLSKACGLLVFCRFLFCGLLFFKSYGTFVVSTYCMLLWKFAHFGLVFRICLPALVFNLPAVFVLLHFPSKRILGLFFGKISYFGLIFASYAGITVTVVGVLPNVTVVLNSNILAGNTARQ